MSMASEVLVNLKFAALRALGGADGVITVGTNVLFEVSVRVLLRVCIEIRLITRPTAAIAKPHKTPLSVAYQRAPAGLSRKQPTLTGRA
jgi:hypothetical protein